MMRLFSRVLICFSVILMSACAKPDNTEPPENIEDKAIVILTYDDTLNSHLDIAMPQLERAGLRGTFYISAGGGDLHGRLADWRAAAKDGHELGNHTLFHPCQKGERDWVKPYYDLNQYTLHQFEEEVRLTNIMLRAIDGRQNRTFAYTCGDMEVDGGKSVIEVLKRHVSAARTVEYGSHDRAKFDSYRIKTIDGAGKSGTELIEAVKAGQTHKALVTFLFHGLSDSEYLVTSAAAHQELIDYLSQNQDDIWTAPLQDVMNRVGQK